MTVPPHIAGFTSTPTTSEIALVNDLYTDAILAAAGDGGRTELVKEQFDASFDKAFDRGYITTDPRKALKDMHWRRVSEKSSDGTNRMIMELDSGQTGFEADEWLDMWVMVGRQKRTTVRFMDPAYDWDLIIEIRKQHHDDAGTVLSAARRVAPRMQAAYAAHGSVEAAIKAGGLLLTAPSKAVAV